MGHGLLGEGLDVTGPGDPEEKAHRVESYEGQAR